jgi:hypothetical protein
MSCFGKVRGQSQMAVSRSEGGNGASQPSRTGVLLCNMLSCQKCGAATAKKAPLLRQPDVNLNEQLVMQARQVRVRFIWNRREITPVKLEVTTRANLADSNLRSRVIPGAH